LYASNVHWSGAGRAELQIHRCTLRQ